MKILPVEFHYPEYFLLSIITLLLLESVCLFLAFSLKFLPNATHSLIAQGSTLHSSSCMRQMNWWQLFKNASFCVCVYVCLYRDFLSDWPENGSCRILQIVAVGSSQYSWDEAKKNKNIWHFSSVIILILLSLL